MHDVIDTESEDQESESYWPDSYKRTIREGLFRHFMEKAGDTSFLRTIRETRFSHRFGNQDDFLKFLARGVGIGGENGSDRVLFLISSNIRKGDPLAMVPPYHEYLWPSLFPEKFQEEIRGEGFAAFYHEHILEHVYEDDYSTAYETYDHFIRAFVERLLKGAMNGADDMLGKILTACALKLPLPPVRRLPRPLKHW